MEWLESQWVFRFKHLKPLLNNPLFHLLSERNQYWGMLSGRKVLIAGFIISLGIFIFQIILASPWRGSGFWLYFDRAFITILERFGFYLRLIGTIATISCLTMLTGSVFRKIRDFKSKGFMDLIYSSPLGNAEIFSAVSMSVILPVFNRLQKVMIFTTGFLTGHILIASFLFIRNQPIPWVMEAVIGLLDFTVYIPILFCLIIIETTISAHYKLGSAGPLTFTKMIFHSVAAIIPALLIAVWLYDNFLPPAPQHVLYSETYLIILVLLIPGIIYNFATGSRAVERARRS